MDTGDQMARYVNVYLEDRAYGGPEEGGWWYDCGEPIESVQVFSDEEEAEKVAELKEKYSNEGRKPIWSVACRGVYGVRVEDHFAESYPQASPMYE
jgi:hypothetical protein